MKKSNIKKIINIVLIILLAISILLLHLAIGAKDLIEFAKWYLVLFAMGLSFLPLNNLIFKKFHDRGYIFSKVFGILFSGFLMWVLSSFKIMKFNVINSYICVIIVFILSLLISKLIIKKNPTIKVNNENIYSKILSILRIELILFFIMSLACYIKGFNSMAYGTEKYMDYGYMATIDRTDYMPPQDMWFSGKKINYYYFGQYISTFITKLSGVGVNYGYNFMLITLFSLTMFECYTLVYNLLSTRINNKKKKYIPVIGGIMASLANTLAANMHYVIFGLIVPIFHIKVENNFWFPDSTRYIENTIHEFPSYSFILGDLHAHVLNIIFVLLAIALIFVYLLNNQKTINTKNAYKAFNIKEIIFNPIIVLLGFMLGIFKMTNYWDFPIYFVVCFIVFLISNMIMYKKIKDIILTTLIQSIMLLTTSTIVSLPFSMSFDMISSVIKPVESRSLVYKLIVLWALPITTVLYFIYITIKDCKFKKFNIEQIMKYIYSLNISDIFSIILGICAIGLVLAPEFVYVVDIYNGDYHRANTMFKLTYQAYMMFGLCFGYMLTVLIFLHKKEHSLLKYKLLFLFVLTILYSYTAGKMWFGNVLEYKNYKTLDAMYFLLDNNYIDENVTSIDDSAVINWLNDHASNDDVILECYGDSFSYEDRISVFTGLATPIGWYNHEWLWRSKNSSLDFPPEVQERMSDVDIIYTSSDEEEVKNLIQKYNIKYIIIGYSEYNYYNNKKASHLNEELLKKLGTIVFSSNMNDNLNIETYIIKIN